MMSEAITSRMHIITRRFVTQQLLSFAFSWWLPAGDYIFLWNLCRILQAVLDLKEAHF